MASDLNVREIAWERMGAMLNTFVKSDHPTRFSCVDFIICTLCLYKVQQKSMKCQFQYLEWVTRNGLSSCSEQLPRETWSITSGLPFYNTASWMIWGNVHAEC